MSPFLQSAKMCDAVYGRYHGGLPARVGICVTDTEYAEIRGRMDGGLDLIYRGTDEGISPWSKDWRRNLDMRFGDVCEAWGDHEHNLCGVSVGAVHQGFLNATKDLLDSVLDNLARYPKEIVHCHGHSHGGPMAAIMAMMLSELGREIGGVTTFGCPNFCDDDWAEAQGLIPTTHLAAGSWPGWRDPVARYPHLMTKSGEMLVLKGRFGPLKNHAMSNYIRLLSA